MILEFKEAVTPNIQHLTPLYSAIALVVTPTPKSTYQPIDLESDRKPKWHLAPELPVPPTACLSPSSQTSAGHQSTQPASLLCALCKCSHVRIQSELCASSVHL